jgi:hypothetical protein
VSPMSLKVLSAVLNLYGPNAALTSDNQGLQVVLRAVQGQIQQQVESNQFNESLGPIAEPAAYNKKYSKTWYFKYYPKFIK